MCPAQVFKRNPDNSTNSRRCGPRSPSSDARRRSYDRSLTTEYLLLRRRTPLLIIVEPRLEGVLGLDRLALAILPRLLPSRRRRRQGLAIKQCLHIRLYESDRVAPWVASQRAAALVEQELLVVKDDARDAPWVGARLGQPCVERQSVRAEQVRLCVNKKVRCVSGRGVLCACACACVRALLSLSPCQRRQRSGTAQSHTST